MSCHPSNLHQNRNERYMTQIQREDGSESESLLYSRSLSPRRYDTIDFIQDGTSLPTRSVKNIIGEEHAPEQLVSLAQESGKSPMKDLEDVGLNGACFDTGHDDLNRKGHSRSSGQDSNTPRSTHIKARDISNDLIAKVLWKKSEETPTQRYSPYLIKEPSPSSHPTNKVNNSTTWNQKRPTSNLTSSYISDFEHTKLAAHVYPDMVVETHLISDSSTGRRKFPKSKVWKVEIILGSGSFGEVRLETHAEENQSRAVKRLWASGSTLKREYERKLKALLEFSKPEYKEAAVFVVSYTFFIHLLA